MKAMKKIMNWVCSNIFWIIMIISLSLYFVSPFISIITTILILIISLVYLINQHLNESKKETLKDISEPPVTQWISLDKYDNKTYRLSIFFDNTSDKYRIVDMNNHIIFCDGFETENDAKKQIMRNSIEVTGLKVHNYI